MYRVLKIAPTSFFADYGCHVRIYEETLALQGLGHKVTICTYHTGRDLAGLDIRRSLRIPWRGDVAVGSSVDRVFYDALLAEHSARVALQLRPGMIHAHLHPGALIGYPISRALRVPLIFDFQGSLTSEMLDHRFLQRNSLWYPALRSLETVINKMACAVITSSANSAGLLMREFGCSGKRVFTVSDCVNTEKFFPRRNSPEEEGSKSLRRSLGIPDGKQIVVYLGLLAEYQGTVKLLQAARKLVDEGLAVHFLIMGYPGADYYSAVAAGMGLGEHTTFTGRVLYDRAPEYLRLGDVAVSPKMSETEGNGKLLNYMACGLPTVAFDTPVARELLGDEGVYASLGDVDSLAAALGMLLKDESGALRIGSRLRARAQTRFSWHEAAKRITEIYDSCN